MSKNKRSKNGKENEKLDDFIDIEEYKDDDFGDSLVKIHPTLPAQPLLIATTLVPLSQFMGYPKM